MKKIFILIVFILVVVVAVFYLKPEWDKSTDVACTLDTKQCPDGTYVGRTGSNCEFESCKILDVSNESVENQHEGDTKEISIGQTITFKGVKITLNEVVQDSRCPRDVQCIWAGNVVINVTLKDVSETKIFDIDSNKEPILFNKYKVSIDDVYPLPVSTDSAFPESYVITLKIIES